MSPRGALVSGEGRWSRSGHERPVVRCREADDGIAAFGDIGELLVELSLVSLRIEIAHGGVEGGAILDAVALGLELGIVVTDGERAAAHASLLAGRKNGPTGSHVEGDGVAERNGAVALPGARQHDLCGILWQAPLGHAHAAKLLDRTGSGQYGQVDAERHPLLVRQPGKSHVLQRRERLHVRRVLG